MMPTANSRFMPFAVPLLSCRVTLPLLPYRAVLPHCTASAVLYRTYVFNKLLPQPSELLTVTLPLRRKLGQGRQAARLPLSASLFAHSCSHSLIPTLTGWQ
jgi:hypothetical protein